MMKVDGSGTEATPPATTKATAANPHVALLPMQGNRINIHAIHHAIAVRVSHQKVAAMIPLGRDGVDIQAVDDAIAVGIPGQRDDSNIEQ